MSVFEALVLGVVQGLTEFLPVSSSAHLALVPWIFGWKDPGLAFDVFLHLGTLIALLGYFFQDLFQLAKGGLRSVIDRRIGFDRDRLLFWYIVAGTIPAVVLGLVAGDFIEAHLRDPLLMAVFLAGVGFLMYWVDGTFPLLRNLDDLSLKDALWIGMAQASALVPGVSRSGATITMGRKLGFSRDAAARFSFLLSVPVILGAIVFESKKLINHIGLDLQWDYLLVGFFASLISGVLAIHFFLQFVRNASLGIFVWYRGLLAAAIVAWSLFHPTA